MPSNPGLSPDGFRPASFEEIRADIEAELRARWGASLPLGDRTPDGHIVAIVAERIARAWSATEDVYGASDPDKATGLSLAQVCLLNAVIALAAAPSSVFVTLCGDDGTVVNAGTRVATASTNKAFATSAPVILSLLDAWVTANAYVKGDRVTNSARCYLCIASGVSGPGPTTTTDDIVDGTVHWRYLGEGTATADPVIAFAEVDGPTFAAEDDITVILTPVGGLDSVRNIVEAVPGRFAMSDEELRLFREANLRRDATGTTDSIRARLLGLAGIEAASVFANVTDHTDDDGQAPHSVEALVRGGDDDAIRALLWANVPAGILTVGTEFGLVTDAEGTSQPVRFSRPEDVQIWIEVHVTAFARDYPGDASVRSAIANWGAARETDDDVVAAAVGAQCFAVPGVLDVPTVLIGTSSPPVSSATIPISKRQIPTFAISRISVITTFGVP